MDLRVVTLIIVCVFLIPTCSSTPPDVTRRIIGGSLAKLKQIPYIVQISNVGKVTEKRDGKTWCSATIVTPRWVISAAHCYRQFIISSAQYNTTVKAGLLDHQAVTSHTQVRKSIRHVIHEPDPTLQRVPDLFNADIILIEVCKPFKFNDYVGSVPIARKPYPHPKKVYCTMMGFGRTDANDTMRNTKLHYTEAYIGGDQDNCLKMNNMTGWTAYHLCIEPEVPGAAGCSGDSGGPLVCEGAMTGVLSGRGNRDLSERNVHCGREGNYHIFIFVGFFESWIREYIPDLPDSQPLVGEKKVWLDDILESGASTPSVGLASIILVLIVGTQDLVSCTTS